MSDSDWCWPAKQLPQLYPPDTLEQEFKAEDTILKRIEKILVKHPKASLEERYKLLQKEGYDVYIRGKSLLLGISSRIAPELDRTLDITDLGKPSLEFKLRDSPAYE